MPDTPSPNERIAVLEERVRLLELENEHLAEQGEDMLLLGIIAEEIGSVDTPHAVLASGLERISILKDVPFCGCCVLAGGTTADPVVYVQSTPSIMDCSITLSPTLLARIDTDSVYLGDSECHDLRITCGDGCGCFDAKTALIVPVAIGSGGTRLFVFADDRPDEQLSAHVVMLHRVVDVVSTRMDMLEVLDSLTVLNKELQRANVALQTATKAKSMFLASMSHELRTPLNSIIGFSGILLQGLAGDLNPEQHKQIDMISRSGHQLLALIGDVLDLVKIESGRVDLSVKDFSLVRAVEIVVESVRPLASEKGLELTLDTTQAPERMVSDRGKVDQVLLNLLSNSIKYTNAGSVRVVVTTPTPETVSIAVSDTGVGIPPSEQEHIFEEFLQLPSARVAKPSGAGLGLAITRRLVELLGGTIELESEVGVGSTFTMTLPVEIKSTGE